MAPTRAVHCQDALQWLAPENSLAGCSVVTSMPDHSEFPQLSLTEWKEWFVGAASLILSRVPDEGVAIFYQSDIKREGAWVDKGYLCQKAAELTGHAQLWHKIVARTPPGLISFGKPGYSHLLCFSRGVRLELGQATPDILPTAGQTTWTRGMGIEACRAACRFIAEHTKTRTVVDPFCGHGTALAVANELGLDAIGVELGRKRAKVARALSTADERFSISP